MDSEQHTSRADVHRFATPKRSAAADGYHSIQRIELDWIAPRQPSVFFSGQSCLLSSALNGCKILSSVSSTSIQSPQVTADRSRSTQCEAGKTVDNRVMQHYLWLVMVASMAAAQAPLPDYFPLQVGNQWVYTRGVSVSAACTVQIGGVTYTVLEYRYGSRVGTTELVRSDGAGKIYQYDPKSQQEFLLYDFTQPVSNPSSNDQSYTISTAGHYSGPLGSFDDAFIIGQRNLFDATTTTFLPYIGMVSSSVANTAGSAALVAPFVSDLFYARLADITVISSQEWGLGLALDQPVYSIRPGQVASCGLATSPGPTPFDPCARVRISLRLKGSNPVRLSFPTQQVYDLKLSDAAGNSIWSLSQTTTYAATPYDLVLKPGELDFAENVPLNVGQAGMLAPGVYRVTATLLDMPGGSASASVAFTVVP